MQSRVVSFSSQMESVSDVVVVVLPSWSSLCVSPCKTFAGGFIAVLQWRGEGSLSALWEIDKDGMPSSILLIHLLSNWTPPSGEGLQPSLQGPRAKTSYQAHQCMGDSLPRTEKAIHTVGKFACVCVCVCVCV